MAVDRKPNKNAATEDELGEIHNLTTQLYLRRLKRMVELANDGIDIEAVIGDGKVLQAASKWVADMNNITSAAPESDEESELGRQLQAIKDKQAGKGTFVMYNDEETRQ